MTASGSALQFLQLAQQKGGGKKKKDMKHQKGTNPKMSTLLLVLVLNLTAVIIPGKTTQQLSSFLQQL